MPDLSVRPTVQTRSIARLTTTSRRSFSSSDKPDRSSSRVSFEQRIDLLVTVGVAGHPDHRFVVVAEPAGQRLVAGHPAARGERDLQQLARREHAFDVLGADENLRASRAMARCSGAFRCVRPTVPSWLISTWWSVAAEIDGSAEKFESGAR